MENIKKRNLKARDKEVKRVRAYREWKKSVKDHEKD